MRALVVGLLMCSTLVSGCINTGIKAGPLIAAMAQAHAGQTAAATANAQAIYLFGGAGHTTFLGCICATTATNSLLNQYSNFGNKYSLTSIFNHYGEFGSPYSAYSACNRYATDPPVIVTTAGQFLGRLTLNQYAAGAIKDPSIVAWLAATCTG